MIMLKVDTSDAVKKTLAGEKPGTKKYVFILYI